MIFFVGYVDGKNLADVPKLIQLKYTKNDKYVIIETWIFHNKVSRAKF